MAFELERVADQPTTVSESLWEFERSLLEALAIVLAVSLLSLGWRVPASSSGCPCRSCSARSRS